MTNTKKHDDKYINDSHSIDCKHDDSKKSVLSEEIKHIWTKSEWKNVLMSFIMVCLCLFKFVYFIIFNH